MTWVSTAGEVKWQNIALWWVEMAVIKATFQKQFQHTLAMFVTKIHKTNDGFSMLLFSMKIRHLCNQAKETYNLLRHCSVCSLHRFMKIGRKWGLKDRQSFCKNIKTRIYKHKNSFMDKNYDPNVFVQDKPNIYF